MTLDELHKLTQALLNDAGVSIEGLRRDSGELLAGLSDDEFLLAIRFLAGEEVEVTGVQMVSPMPGPRPRRERQIEPLDDDEMARRLAAIEELEEETPVRGSGPLDLGDGIFLP